MHRHDVIESSLDTVDQDFPVIDINAELPLEGIVDHDAGPHTQHLVLSVPVGFVGDWDSVPSDMVNFPESISDAPDNPLGEHMRLKKANR